MSRILPSEAHQVTSNAGEVGYANSRVPGFLHNPYLTLVSRLVLGFIFALSGLTKLGVPNTFAVSINSYEMHLPSVLVTIMAVALPPIELAIGIWLLVGLFTRFSAAVAGVLMLVFIVAMIQAMFRGLSPDCGCFAGAGSNGVGTAVMAALGPVGEFLAAEKVGPESLIRDLIFLLMAANLFFVPSIFSLDNLRRRRAATEDLSDYEAWAQDENAALGEDDTL